jgi:hypothetical protein
VKIISAAERLAKRRRVKAIRSRHLDQIDDPHLGKLIES